MRGYTLPSFSEAPFLREQEIAVITAYRNVFIQDDPGIHFRQVIRGAEDQQRRYYRNPEPDAGEVLNTRFVSDNPLRQ